MKTFFALIALMLCSMTATAQITEDDAHDAVLRRQAVFKLIAVNNRTLGMMLRSKELNKETAIKALQRIAMLADMIPELFITDTRAAPGLTTRAAVGIWDNMDDFSAIATELSNGANGAIELLQSQENPDLRQAFSLIGPNCQACHDSYRLK